MADEPPAPTENTLRFRYKLYSIELMAEVLHYFSKYLRAPDDPRGVLILTLKQLIAALEERPYNAPEKGDT